MAKTIKYVPKRIQEMRFAPELFMAAWRGVQAASVTSKWSLELNKTVVIEQYETGVMLSAFDGQGALLWGWVPELRNWEAARPEVDDAPTAMCVVVDKGLTTPVFKIVDEALMSDNAPTGPLTIDWDQRHEDTEAAQLDLGIMVDVVNISVLQNQASLVMVDIELGEDGNPKHFTWRRATEYLTMADVGEVEAEGVVWTAFSQRMLKLIASIPHSGGDKSVQFDFGSGDRPAFIKIKGIVTIHGMVTPAARYDVDDEILMRRDQIRARVDTDFIPTDVSGIEDATTLNSVD